MHLTRCCFTLLTLFLSSGAIAIGSDKALVKVKADQQIVQPEQEQGLQLNYRIGQQPIQSMIAPTNQVGGLFWDLLRKSVVAARNKLGTPVATQVFIPYPDDMRKSLQGTLPNLEMQTQVNVSTKGKIDFVIAPFESPIKEGNQTGEIVWKGLQGRMTFIGELKSPAAKFSVPGLKLAMKNELDMDWQGGRFEAAFNEYDEPEKLHFSLPFFQLLTPKEETMVMKGSRFRMNLEEPSEGLKVGMAEGLVESLDFAGNGNKIQIKGIKLSSLASLKPKSRMEYGLDFSVAGVSIDIPTEKKSLKQIKLRSKFEVKSLDSTVIADLQKASRQMEAQNMPPDMLSMVMLGKLKEAVPKLVAASPSLVLHDFYLETELGHLNINFNVTIDGKKPFPFDQLDIMKMAVDADARLIVSKPLLRYLLALGLQEKLAEAAKKGVVMPSATKIAETQIQTYVAQRLLLENEKDYTAEATLHNGKLLLNGLDLPLPF